MYDLADFRQPISGERLGRQATCLNFPEHTLDHPIAYATLELRWIYMERLVHVSLATVLNSLLKGHTLQLVFIR